MPKGVVRQEEQPKECQQPAAFRQSRAFRVAQVEQIEERLHIERRADPTGHVFRDLSQLEGRSLSPESSKSATRTREPSRSGSPGRSDITTAYSAAMSAL
ncbi:hypothetical protein GCM10011583_30820 [Streptomyces camponoticapitis]|uniref:Uncharacterized protein n=1 Tax=Streptomyces camponoticapitis TaxID=1616125 RepID=A0ABQ2E6G6_9ACTN|nr:hypothetical protein GCM10011583_30820 [Streptomyces camponoticapitis]